MSFIGGGLHIGLAMRKKMKKKTFVQISQRYVKPKLTAVIGSINNSYIEIRKVRRSFAVKFSCVRGKKCKR